MRCDRRREPHADSSPTTCQTNLRAEQLERSENHLASILRRRCDEKQLKVFSSRSAERAFCHNTEHAEHCSPPGIQINIRLCPVLQRAAGR